MMEFKVPRATQTQLSPKMRRASLPAPTARMSPSQRLDIGDGAQAAKTARAPLQAHLMQGLLLKAPSVSTHRARRLTEIPHIPAGTDPSPAKVSTVSPPITRWGRAQPQHPRSLSHRAFTQLWSVFEPQQTESACSLASATWVINALGTGIRPRMSQDQVAALDTTGLWARATRDDGPGIDLDALCDYLRVALGNDAVKVSAFHVEPHAGGPSAEILRRALRDSEHERDMFVIVNANQSLLFDEGDDVGHFVVAAGWDEQRGRVLVLDPDRYGVMPIEALEDAMRTRSDESGELRGFITIRG
jgi:hypothetical protein